MIRYQDYQLPETTHTRENTEWSISYSFNARDTENPRVLLIGDSVCNAYQSGVRQKLGNNANVTFWASSKCVTDPDYLRELNFLLDTYWYDAICFNNGLHSLTASPDEWEEAYANVIRFISDKCKGIPLFLVLSTPIADRDKNAIVVRFNEYVSDFAYKKGFSVIDLWSPMSALNKREHMSDAYHWKAEAVGMQADIVASALLPLVAPEPEVEETAEAAVEETADATQENA